MRNDWYTYENMSCFISLCEYLNILLMGCLANGVEWNRMV